MKKLLTVLLSILLVLGLSACTDGKKEEKVLHVGVVQLVKHDALDAATQGFVDVLNENFDKIEIDVKNASGDSANCTTIVNGFVADNVDLIMANATPALQAAAAATNSIPVLGTSITEYGIALGIDGFTGTTGTNVSGTSDLADLKAQAQMILDICPETKTVAIIFSSNEDNSKYQVKVVKEYLESKGITVLEKSFSSTDNIALVVAQACEEADAIFLPTDNACADNGDTIFNETSKAGKPVFCGEEGTCVKTGVATLTIDYYRLGRITGEMAVKILKGEADVKNMPVEYFSDHYELTKKFNKSICESLNITVPSDFIAIE